MNERIDELMRQAGIFKPKEFYQHIDALQLEKFAELIVKECADELIKWKDEPFPYDPEFGASLIKSLFGVEE
jgi:hypothetical protein